MTAAASNVKGQALQAPWVSSSPAKTRAWLVFRRWVRAIERAFPQALLPLADCHTENARAPCGLETGVCCGPCRWVRGEFGGLRWCKMNVEVGWMCDRL